MIKESPLKNLNLYLAQYPDSPDPSKGRGHFSILIGTMSGFIDAHRGEGGVGGRSKKSGYKNAINTKRDP
jgi:hypothetical protein